MRHAVLFLIALFFTCCLSAQGDIYSFSRLDINNGLSNNQVNAILKDRSGFVWFGTMSGLNRYDSYGFKVFRNSTADSTSINDNYVSGLYELPDQRMLVITRSGPNVYNARTEKFERNYRRYLHSYSLPAAPIHAVIRDRKNNYWFVYDSLGVYRYDPSSKAVTAFNYQRGTGSGIASNNVSTLREDQHGNIWLVHKNGIVERINSAATKVDFRTDALSKKNNSEFNYDLFIDNDNDLWFWTTNEPNGAFLFNPIKKTITQFNENGAGFRINNNLITGIIQDAGGVIWIGTDHGGVNLVDKNDNYRITHLVSDAKNLKSLAQNSIYSIYKDDAGIIWIGTYKHGINYLDEKIVKFAHYRHLEAKKESLPFDDVNRFVEDKDGNLWIGTNGGGLIYFNRRQQSFKQYVHNPVDANSISNNVIVSLCLDHDGKLWIGTYLGGLNCFDGKKFVHYRHDQSDNNSIIDDRIWEIFEDSKQNLWVGTLAGGLDLFDRENGRFIHHQFIPGQQSPIQSNYISALIEDKHKNLWIGTAYGLDMFENGTGKIIHYGNVPGQETLSNNNIISLLQDWRGRIWIGTREGLNLFDPVKKTFRSFFREHGLPDNTILNIVDDNRGNLWITTPNGLCNLVLHEADAVSNLSFSVIKYDVMNNLQSREFNDNAALKTRAGEIIVGGPFGFNIIHPTSIVTQTSRPRIVFTNLQVLNKNVVAGETVNKRIILPEAISSTNTLKLKYKENIFSVEFAALDFSHGSNVKYAYMLENFNEDWVYTDENQRRITYTNLDPGSYLLKVKAVNNNNTWSEEKTMRITIDPPFWRTPVAFVMYAILIIAVLFLARRMTLERAHMRFEVQQQRKEAERVQMLDRMKTKFFTNVSHEFRTPLSLIISPLDKIIKNTSDADQKKQLHLVHRNAKRLLSLVNQLLDFRKMEVQEFKLYPVAGDIVRFIKEISFSFSDIAEKKNILFDFHSSVESLEIYFDRDKVEKIMFNLLSNAYKYTHDSGVVWVHLNYEEGIEKTFCIEIGDTGIGIPADKHERVFERFFQNDMPDSVINQGSGIGLAITKEFVKMHNGTITLESEPEKGTTFMVRLPAKGYHDEQHAVVVPADEQQGGDENMSKRRSTILLVEDNEDFRFYLKDNLKSCYNVVEAVNGKEGWEKARTSHPDLIVSDIMMPLMTGIELAHRIKTEPLTAGIPVILLTAMGSQEVQLEGYQKGANDYITKPFTFEILAMRIKNLLDQQKLLRKKFNKQVEINPGDITVTHLDELFIKQATEIVGKNISNADFSVEDFSQSMFMSRVALYKKILALTGKGPLEFIRTIRLKRAAQLLRESGMTIAEVAYEVGFNNPKTFSRYFKEEFQVLPSQYQG
jgi:signal transduction histidine kinase/ligand-binding sensor domain-containing protein/DNA-binding response OmpR family regulator